MLSLVTQYYNDPNKSRQKEIDLCLALNLEHPAIERVYCLVEPDTSVSPELLSNSKLTCVDVPGRLTYLMAFEFANKELPVNTVVMVANSDIFLPEDNHSWAEIAEPGRYGVYDPLLKRHRPIALCLSRHELTEDHEPYKHPMSFVGNCQDSWVAQVPVRHTAQMDFHVGNAPTCDNRIAWALADVGYETWNWSQKYRTNHLDLARKGETVKMIFNEDTDRGLASRSDLGVRHVCPYFSYENYLNKPIDDKNNCDHMGKHRHGALSNIFRALFNLVRKLGRKIRRLVRYIESSI